MGATRLNDGHPTFITFSEDSSIKFWVKELTPVGIDTGGPIDTTTMHNTAWRTRIPKALKQGSEMVCLGAYATDFYTEFLAMAGVNQLITVTFPDSSTLVFWGYLDKLSPQRIVEGTQPEIEITIVPTFENGSQVETDPVVS